MQVTIACHPWHLDSGIPAGMASGFAALHSGIGGTRFLKTKIRTADPIVNQMVSLGSAVRTF